MFFRSFTLISSALIVTTAALTPIATAESYNHAISTQTYSVELNKTEIVRLTGSANAVVIGNPAIADVSVHSDNTIFVVGRSFGETNVIILDKYGSTLLNANVQVTNNLPATGVRLYSGTNRQTYNCAPYCLPAPVLGDDLTFRAENSSTAQPINNEIATVLPNVPQSNQGDLSFSNTSEQGFDGAFNN